jgi:transcriptional regulator with XRE-family HTH domain
MKNFAELLTLYIKQAGITDAELARSIGVSRQTIFRWREGLTGRPNSREDIIAIAKKLRLSPAERDALLLAGGFRPDDIALSDRETSDLTDITTSDGKTIGNTEEMEPKGQYTPPGRLKVLIPKPWRFVVYTISALILIAAGVWLVISNLPFDESGNNNVSGNQPTDTPAAPTTVIPAAPGEILLVVTQFDTTDASVRITDQIFATLQRESINNRIPNIRVGESPQTVSKIEQATQMLQEKGASLIIYGECNANLVTVNMLPVPGQTLSPIIVNDGDSISITSLSFVALGKICIDTGNAEQAVSFLSKARNILIDNNVTNDTILSVIDELSAEVNNLSVQ